MTFFDDLEPIIPEMKNKCSKSFILELENNSKSFIPELNICVNFHDMRRYGIICSTKFTEIRVELINYDTLFINDKNNNIYFLIEVIEDATGKTLQNLNIKGNTLQKIYSRDTTFKIKLTDLNTKTCKRLVRFKVTMCSDSKNSMTPISYDVSNPFKCISKVRKLKRLHQCKCNCSEQFINIITQLQNKNPRMRNPYEQLLHEVLKELKN